MRNIIFVFSVMLMFISCNDMFDSIKNYAIQETVYSGQFDTISYKLGFERVELDLLKAGRIPSKNIKLGKAKKTVIEYDNQKIVIDSVCSWVNLTELSMPKLYRIKAYTIDEYENKSVPQEIAIIPFTRSDLKNLTVTDPKVIASPWAVSLSWANLSSVLLNYCDLEFKYTDKDNNTIEGTREDDPFILMENLDAGEQASISLTYRVVPKVNDEEILDTVYLDKIFYMYMPTSDVYQRELKNRSIKTINYQNSQEIEIEWDLVDNHTLTYSELKYIDTTNPLNPVEQLIRIDNEEVVTLAHGLRIGTPFYVRSNYKPDGVDGVYINSDWKEYNPEFLDYLRTNWEVTPLHTPATDGNSGQNIVDNEFSTFLSIAKPGKSAKGSSVPADELTGFTIDLQESLSIDYYRIMHRNTTVGLRVWGLSLYGSDDNTNWQPIKENIVTTDFGITSVLESPNIKIPRSFFRYIKVIYTDWDPVSNSVCQLSEFYMGASSNPILH